MGPVVVGENPRGGEPVRWRPAGMRRSAIDRARRGGPPAVKGLLRWWWCFDWFRGNGRCLRRRCLLWRNRCFRCGWCCWRGWRGWRCRCLGCHCGWWCLDRYIGVGLTIKIAIGKQADGNRGNRTDDDGQNDCTAVIAADGAFNDCGHGSFSLCLVLNGTRGWPIGSIQPVPRPGLSFIARA